MVDAVFPDAERTVLDVVADPCGRAAQRHTLEGT